VGFAAPERTFELPAQSGVGKLPSTGGAVADRDADPVVHVILGIAGHISAAAAAIGAQILARTRRLRHRETPRDTEFEASQPRDFGAKFDAARHTNLARREARIAHNFQFGAAATYDPPSQ
jgi:hypothetical protein